MLMRLRQNVFTVKALNHEILSVVKFWNASEASKIFFVPILWEIIDFYFCIQIHNLIDIIHEWSVVYSVTSPFGMYMKIKKTEVTAKKILSSGWCSPKTWSTLKTIPVNKLSDSTIEWQNVFLGSFFKF